MNGPASTNQGQGKPDFIPPFVPGRLSPSPFDSVQMNKIVRASNRSLGLRAGKGIRLIDGDFGPLIEIDPSVADLLRNPADAASAQQSGSVTTSTSLYPFAVYQVPVASCIVPGNQWRTFQVRAGLIGWHPTHLQSTSWDITGDIAANQYLSQVVIGSDGYPQGNTDNPYDYSNATAPIPGQAIILDGTNEASGATHGSIISGPTTCQFTLTNDLSQVYDGMAIYLRIYNNFGEVYAPEVWIYARMIPFGSTDPVFENDPSVIPVALIYAIGSVYDPVGGAANGQTFGIVQFQNNHILNYFNRDKGVWFAQDGTNLLDNQWFFDGDIVHVPTGWTGYQGAISIPDPGFASFWYAPSYNTPGYYYWKMFMSFQKVGTSTHGEAAPSPASHTGWIQTGGMNITSAV